MTVDRATGALLAGGRRLFPICLSNPPPPGGKAPGGRDGLAELAAAGAGFVRTGRAEWSLELAGAQLEEERARLDAAAAHGLRCWLWLGDAANLPPPAADGGPSPRERLLERIVTALRGHPALGAWKGVDEPRNPFRGDDWVRPAGLVRAYRKVKALDPGHPLVIVQAPRNTVAELTPYRPAFDITGADVYPVAYPPGRHAGTPRRDVGVVGDVTRKMVAAAGAKPVWTTLQIAWSGTTPSRDHPGVVPRFPTLHEERFMAYQAIVSGARGLVFFGGHLTQVCTPGDAKLGWNWTFWELVLRPLLRELTSTAVGPALVAPAAGAQVTASAGDVELAVRREGGFLYVIAVRRGGATSLVRFSGLPRRRDGRPIGGGEALWEHVQEPPPPPIVPGRQVFRRIAVADGSFRDWLGPLDARVYRFPI
ncbi:MAG TPA: hypothetical protein VFB42_12125 [Gaiellaceae bacterium]|nr:hypothetical protein [Gaiellaceae bacterium]